MKNLAKKLRKFFSGKKKYFLVLLLFVITAIYGSNFEINETEKTLLHRQNQGIYDVVKDRNEVVFERLISTDSGNGYRLLFDLSGGLEKALPKETAKTMKVELSLSDDFGHEQLIGTIELLNGERILNSENIFFSERNFRHILIRKDDPDHQWKLVFSNVVINALNIKTQSEIEQLATTIKGNADFGQIVQSNYKTQKMKSFIFNRKNQKIGQIFVANSDMISTVSLSMKFLGTGGSGNYMAEIYPYDQKTGINTERLGYYSFNFETARDDLENKNKENFYDIPLAVRLEMGKSYVFLINNSKVTFNPQNTLKIFGYRETYDGNKLFLANGKSKSEKNSSLYFQLHGAKYTEYLGKRILSDALIQDLGGGKMTYTYRQRGNYSDYLDLYETFDKSSPKTAVFYDNILRGVSAKDRGNTSFTYKFDTIFRFDNVAISIEQPGGGFTDTVLSYSFDNLNWQNIEMGEYEFDKAKPTNKFQKIIQTDNRPDVFYLRVTYDEQDSREKKDNINQVEMFAIRNIAVQANLIK